MRLLQIIFLISFAFLVLVVPFLVINFIIGNGTNLTLVIFVALIFIVNAGLILRKLLNLKKEN